MNETAHHEFNPSPRRRRTRWWIPFVVILSVIVVLVIAVFGFTAYIASEFKSINGGFDPNSIVISDNSVLKLDFGFVSEVQGSSNPFAVFSSKAPKPTFYELIEGILTAANDPQIIGIYYEGDAYLGGQMQKELQIALTEFKKSGKFIYSYLESAMKTQYAIASLSDSIFVPDEGMYEISGFGITNVFMKGLYDKIGVEFAVVQCEDFKTAAEPYKLKKFSDSSRLAYKVLLADREEEFINTLSSQRNITREQVVECMNRGILDADEMLELHLADAKGSKRDVQDLLELRMYQAEHKEGKEKVATKDTKDVTIIVDGKDTIAVKSDYKDKLVSIKSYISHLSLMNDNAVSERQIAVICGEGPIVSTVTTSPYTFSRETQIVSNDFVKLLKEATEDSDIEGIILRINSPGGSVIASEEIYQAVIRAKKVKPVYCSMSDVAASGGYYIAMACDTIIAHPKTITGSIGVLAAFPNVSKLIGNLYMNVDTISNGVGKNFFMDPQLPMKTEDVAVFDKMIHNTYKRFVTKAAASRKMSFEELRASAKGRVWLGKDAYERKLVDTLGNLQTAISMMKKRIGGDSNDISLRFMPKKEDGFAQFMKMFDTDMSIADIYSMLTQKSDYTLLANALQLSPALREQLNYQMTLSAIAAKERVIIALPYMMNKE
jgi:protease-4